MPAKTNRTGAWSHLSHGNLPWTLPEKHIIRSGSGSAVHAPLLIDHPLPARQ